jgi:class 3 adenylate cyclase
MATESVTILFTDVVGSTELSRRLSAEAADEVRHGHFSVLRQAIAETGGTEVKNLGDGLMVAFSSAAAGLACAVAMQQSVDRDNRDRENPLGIRVGLSGGEVSKEHDDYFGDPVVEAARLCAACESGQNFGRGRGPPYGRTPQSPQEPLPWGTDSKGPVRPCGNGRSLVGAVGPR